MVPFAVVVRNAFVHRRPNGRSPKKMIFDQHSCIALGTITLWSGGYI